MDETTPQLPAGAVRTVQIIAFALLQGIVIFMGVAVYLNQTRGPMDAGGGSLLSYLSAGFFVIIAVIWFVMPSHIMKAQVKRIAAGVWTPPASDSPRPADTFATDEAKLMAVYQTGNIIGWALLEGAAFFAGIAYLLEGKTLPLYIVGAAVLLMLQTFPTRNLIENWINNQKGVIEDLRYGTELERK